MLTLYNVQLDFDYDVIHPTVRESEFDEDKSMEWLSKGLEGCPLNVMNVLEIVDHFMTFNDAFAQFYVKIVFPFFADCQWKWGGTDYSGWELKRDGVCLSLHETETEDMDAQDRELYFPVMCEFIYNAMTGGNNPNRRRIYDYIVRASAVDQVSTEPSWPAWPTDAEFRKMGELDSLIKNHTASDDL